MGFKNVIKKWGTYALGIAALAGGFVASNVIADNSVMVSAAENDRYFLINFSSANMSGSTSSKFLVQDARGSYNELKNFNYLRIGINLNLNTQVSYDSNSRYFVDIDNLDNFNYERDVVRRDVEIINDIENTRTFQSSEINLYSKSGRLTEYLEKGIYSSKLYNAALEIAKNTVTLTDETVDLQLGTGRHVLSFEYIEHGNYAADYSTGSISGNIRFNEYFEITCYGNNPSQENRERIFKMSINNRTIDEMLNGSGYSEEELNAKYEEGFNAGVESLGPTEETAGKNIYFIEKNTHGSLSESKSIIVDETNYSANVLNTTLFFSISNGGNAFKYYSEGNYFINIDEVMNIEDIEYSNIVRLDNNIREVTSTYGSPNVIFYSPSGIMTKFLNSTDFELLSNKLIDLIKTNEIIPMSEDTTSLTTRFSHLSLDSFGSFIDIVVDEQGNQTLNCNYLSNFGVHVNSGQEVELNVKKRNYDDAMFGVYGNGYSEEEYLIYGEQKYQEGYLDGVHAVENGEDAGTSIPENSDYFRGWESGFQAGVESVDITQDNEEAINEYIASNNMKTEEEYLTYGEEKYQEGKDENANEYAERLNELDATISNLNKEIDTLNNKINNYESTDDKYQLGWENGKIYGESIGFDRGFKEALDVEIEEYGQEQYTKGYNTALSIGFSNGYNQAMQEKDEEIGNIEQEKDSLVEQVESLQNDITNLNNRINTLTGTINNMNGLLDTKYQEGFEDGVSSVDITSDNEEIYNKGFSAGYTQCEIDHPPIITYPENTYEFGFREGFAAGAKSVDITTDNQQAIEDYITNEKMKTEEEFLSYGEEKYSLGYKDNAFGKQMKRLGSNIGTFFVNLGKGIVQYVAFGWAWDKSGKFMPNF